jgi:hypothetical protein
MAPVFYNEEMFFRRKLTKSVTFDERLENLKNHGFEVKPLDGGRVEARRGGCAAIIGLTREGKPRLIGSGLLVGGDIATLVDGGFQKFLEAPQARRRPALAAELKKLHDFQEDLDEALGLESLYNESLGTVCDRHAYDRLTGRP